MTLSKYNCSSSPEHGVTCSLSTLDDKHEDRMSTDTFYDSGPGGEGSYPPPLVPKRCVPLPALSQRPLHLNPLLSHSLTRRPPIVFDLLQSSSTAILSPSLNSDTVTCTANWRQQPATHPATIGSMTLRFGNDNPIFPIWRPIIVFPVSPFDSVVTIDDVLKAVSHAFRMAVRDVSVQLSSAGRRRSGRRRDQAELRGQSIPVNGDGLRSDRAVWWGGLYPSTTERDVWVLDTRHQAGR